MKRSAFSFCQCNGPINVQYRPMQRSVYKVSSMNATGNQLRLGVQVRFEHKKNNTQTRIV